MVIFSSERTVDKGNSKHESKVNGIGHDISDGRNGGTMKKAVLRPPGKMCAHAIHKLITWVKIVTMDIIIDAIQGASVSMVAHAKSKRFSAGPNLQADMHVIDLAAD